MPNLVGIGLSQVPTNSMLGGMAYQDPDRVKIKKLHIDEISQINSETADTAVDVFIYDTSKDSDGGAWRKRTQHTSWYNETLGTTTRGTRREFPSVAVIVSTTAKVTIYDGDDPDLPMWMVFNAGSNGINNVPLLQYSGQDGYHLAALNGILVIGEDTNGDNWGSPIINFISEYIVRMDPHSTEGGIFNGGVAQRHDNVGFNSPGKLIIVNSQINDVAMTVLPNAPIDDATGLPVPTIAVATDGGVSVIKDDGTVFDVIDSNGSRKCYDVSFTKDHKLMHTGDLGAGSTHAGNVFVTNILTADRAEYDNHSDLYRWYSTSQNYPRINGGDTFNTRVLDPVDVGGHHYAMADDGISLIEDGKSSSVSNTDGMVAYITSDYNSGYQHGDIKGAFLSDTDATNITGTELVTNGTFDSDSNWEKSSHWTISGGSASMPSTSNYKPLYQYNLGLTAGVKYVASVDVSAISGQVKFDTASSSGSSIDGLEGVVFSTTGTHSFTFIAESNQDGIGVARQVGNTASCTIDNISVRIAEEDRSVNDNGLQVFGTITKTAVATGAELVGYRPPSGTIGDNYLSRPLSSSDFDLTSNWIITFWAKRNGQTADNYSGFEIAENDLSGNNAYDKIPFSVYIDNAGNTGWRGANVTGYQYNTLFSNSNVWKCVTTISKSGNLYIYVNGEYVTSTPATFANPSNPYSLGIFRFTYSTTRHDGRRHIDYALFRMSESAPSPEQVKKMYEDEKVLFQENAACTLYGSSDAVTALAYDEVTERLHVGTSSGRSDFQGLRRINNTTTAVTTAISAHDEFIIEQ